MCSKPKEKSHGVGAGVTLLMPSKIYHIYSNIFLSSAGVEESVFDKSQKYIQNGELPKLQVVKKEGNWFALNNAQLDLYRWLEDEGKCSKVKVDIVSLNQVPRDIRGMMTVPQEQKEASSAQSSTKQKKTNTKGYERLDQTEDGASDQETDSEDDDEDSFTESSDFADSESDYEWSESEYESSNFDSSGSGDDDKCTDNEKETLL